MARSPSSGPEAAPGWSPLVSDKLVFCATTLQCSSLKPCPVLFILSSSSWSEDGVTFWIPHRVRIHRVQLHSLVHTLTNTSFLLLYNFILSQCDHRPIGNTLTLTLTLTRLVKKVKDRSMSSSSQPQVCDICPFVLNTCSEHMNSGSLHRPLHAAAAVAESTSSAVDVAETETTDHKRIINPSLTRCYSGLFRSFLHCRTCTEDEACSRASSSFAFTNLQLNSLIVHLSGNDVLFFLHSI